MEDLPFKQNWAWSSLNPNFNSRAEHVRCFDVVPEIHVWGDQAYENVLCIIGFMGVWHLLNSDPMFGQWATSARALIRHVSLLQQDPRFPEQMHDTGQLRVAGRRIDPTHFKGVFVADCMPWSKMSTGSEWSIILNTNPSSQPGEHWVAVANKPDRRGCWFFDSYGLKPTCYRPLLWRRLKACRANTEDYQHDQSTVCGDYALFFLRLFHATPPSRFSWVDLRRYFDPHDDAENDAAVHDAEHGWFPKLLNGQRHDETTHGQVGGERTSPRTWEDPETCLRVVQRNRSRHV